MTSLSIHKKYFFLGAQSDENFLRENSLPIQTYTGNRLCAIDMYENIVTRIFLTQNFCEQN